MDRSRPCTHSIPRLLSSLTELKKSKPEKATAAISRLCPVLDIDGESYVALTQQPAGVDRKTFGKTVCNLGRYRSDIIAALNFIISGI